MRTVFSFAVAATIGVAEGPASADSLTYYPYHTNTNYCPAGLQPIVMAGVISCGSPNTHMTWQQVMHHPTPVSQHAASKQLVCQEGEKGC